MRRTVLILLLLPASAWAQLVPGRGHVLPAFGASFGTTDLLSSTTELPLGIYPDFPDQALVATSISLDPGSFFGLRYTYNVTRRLAVEAEFSTGLSVLVIQLLDLDAFAAQEGGEPQYETTTMDARTYRYFANLTYHVGDWAAHPFVSLGVGGRTMDLRQKGPIKTDPIKDVSCMVGAGLMFRGNQRLGIRAELRDYMYNFYFDNQFAGADSGQLVSNWDIGPAVAAAGPRFQNDLVISLGFEVRIH